MQPNATESSSPLKHILTLAALVASVALAQSLSVSVGGTSPGGARIGIDVDVPLAGGFLLFERGWIHPHDAGARISVSHKIAPRLALAPGVVMTRPGHAREAIGLTYLRPAWLVYVNGIPRSHGSDIGAEWTPWHSGHWFVKLSTDALILNGYHEVSAHIGLGVGR